MSGKYILNNGTGELDIIPGQENKRTWLDKHEAKLGVPLNQPVLPFNPNEIKPTKPISKPLVQTPFFPDTVEGVNHFIKYAKMDAKTPKDKKNLDNLAITMKKSLLEDYRKEIQPFDQYDKSTYPSDPKQRGKLLEADKLEKDLEPERFNDKILKRDKYEPKKAKRNYWDHFRKTGKIYEPTKEEMKRVSGPSAWDIVYQSMTPLEKGRWNAEKRKQGMNGKTAEPLKTKNETESTDMMKEITKNINREIEAIRQFNILKERSTKADPPNLEIRKPEPYGLHETFTKDKLFEGDILKQIKEDNEKI